MMCRPEKKIYEDSRDKGLKKEQRTDGGENRKQYKKGIPGVGSQ